MEMDWKIAELTDFVALVLEHKGSWKIRRENNKQMRSCIRGKRLQLRSYLVAIDPDVCSAINAHLEKILNRLQDGDNALDIVEETKIKPKKTMTAKSGKRSGMKKSPKKSKPSVITVLDIVKEKDQEMKEIWEAIEGLRTLILSKDNSEKIPVNAHKVDQGKTVDDCLLKLKQAKDNKDKKNDIKKSTIRKNLSQTFLVK